MSIPRRIMYVFGYLLIAVIVAMLVFVLVSNATKKVPFIFGKAVAWVITNSMEPEIPAQSYILIRKIDAKDVKVGDVITFVSDDPQLEGGRNTHRVVEIIGDNEEFVTKGDAAYENDTYTAKARNVLAVYEKNLPALTSIGRFFFSGIGIMVSCAAILLITMLLYVPEMVRANRRQAEEMEKQKQEQIDELIRQEVERLKAEGTLKVQGAAAVCAAEAAAEHEADESPAQNGTDNKEAQPEDEKNTTQPEDGEIAAQPEEGETAEGSGNEGNTDVSNDGGVENV
ncbi:MAG: signal peptidase I [Clostridia bacterium]|nr:signal peptidase I [Clostridia bacterium]